MILNRFPNFDEYVAYSISGIYRDQTLPLLKWNQICDESNYCKVHFKTA